MPDRAAQLLNAYGAWAVFAWAVAKSVFPVPLPAMPLLAGAAVAAGTAGEAFLPLAGLVAVPGALGMAVGGSALYWLTLARGEAVLLWLGPRLGFSRQAAEALLARLGGRRGAVIFALRAVPPFPAMAGSLAAGLLRAGPVEYFVWSFLGGLPRCLMLGYAGWALRRGYAAFTWKGPAGLYAVLAVAALALLLRARLSDRR